MSARSEHVDIRHPFLGVQFDSRRGELTIATDDAVVLGSSPAATADELLAFLDRCRAAIRPPVTDQIEPDGVEDGVAWFNAPLADIYADPTGSDGGNVRITYLTSRVLDPGGEPDEIRRLAAHLLAAADYAEGIER